MMSIGKSGSAMTNLQLAFAATAGTTQLFVQFISDPLTVQTVSALVTMKGTVRCFESATNDNIDAVTSKVIITSGDGQTLRGTLFNLGNYGPVAELNSGSLRAKRIADGDTDIGLVTTVAGDRLVFEIGLTTTVGGTTISGTMNFGDNSATDLGDNETDTAANNPFVEFSHDFVFLQYTTETADLNGTNQSMIGTKWQ